MIGQKIFQKTKDILLRNQQEIRIGIEGLFKSQNQRRSKMIALTIITMKTFGIVIPIKNLPNLPTTIQQLLGII